MDSASLVLIFEILLLILFVGISAFCSSSEMSLFSLSRAKVLSYKDSSSSVERRIYMLMTIAADAVAIPVAVSIASRYLEEFAYRISLEAWIFAVTVLLSLAITGLSTVWQIRKAARANPADALKSE